VIVDECNAYKNPQTKRWKVLNALLQPDTMVWMMTGTPAAQSPVDAYGLAKIVNPSGVPRFQTAWRDIVMRQLTRFKWAPKADAHERVHAALQPAIRYTKKQCLDLPPVLTTTREAPMTPQQEKYYKILKTQMLSHVAGETISAVNAAAVVNKLLQISAGAAYTDTHEVVEFDCTPRLAVLMEVLDETPNKTIVFAHYRHSIDTIKLHLTKHGVPCDVIHGDVSRTKRSEIFHKFQTDPTLRVLVLQEQAAAHGITLTAADTVVFWGPVMSVEMYIQCVARTDRIGQVSDHVTVVHIQGSDIERRMFKLLGTRVVAHDLFVKLYEEEKES
jgi:SNF2 family DNA or RNA helicase